MRETNPFLQLERCHRRLEEACDALSIASADRDGQTIADVKSFLDRQIKRHEEDEDESLFPRLRQIDAATSLIPVVDRLIQEHRQHEALHAELAKVMSEVPAPSNEQAWSAIESVCERIARAYRAHIEVEEKELFPEAQRLLTDDARAAMLAEMSARRGK